MREALGELLPYHRRTKIVDLEPGLLSKMELLVGMVEVELATRFFEW